MIIERKLPVNVQAEQMLLGAILINNDLLNQVNEFLQTDHFYETLHQRIYKSILILEEKGLIATTVTMQSMLGKDELFIESGGREYLVKLTTMAMVVINCRDYGRIIYDLAIKRNLINIGEEIVNNAYNSTLEHTALQQLESAETFLYELAQSGINEKSFMPMGNSVVQSINSINRALKSNDHVIGISTGIFELDKKLAGFQNSDLIIVAGRPAMGKTAFAINFALNACRALNRRTEDNSPKLSVGFFSLEMSSEQISTRLLSTLTKIDSSALRTGKNLDGRNLHEEQYNALKKAADELGDMNFFIDDTPALTIAAIRSRARKLKRKHNLGILFVDYLQLIRGTTKGQLRVFEISEITQGLKAIAKELNIPVVVLSQLSRAVEQREDKMPVLSDLRDSGTIEQDADIVMFLHREEYYLKRKSLTMNDPNYIDWQNKLLASKDVASILIAKHRNGAVGKVDVSYMDKYSLIGDRA